MDVNRNLETHNSGLLCPFMSIGISTSGMKAGLLEEILALFMMDGRFWMQHPRKEAKVTLL